MNPKVISLIDTSVFQSLVMERKKGDFLLMNFIELVKKIWNEAQKDILTKLYEFEKQEKILIITDEDRELLHGFNFTQKSHIEAKKHLREFLKKD